MQWKLVGSIMAFNPVEFYCMDNKTDTKKSSSVLHRRKKSYRFGTTWGRENEDRIFIFGWSLPFQSVFLLSLCHENMARGFRGNNEIVFKCFRTSRLYSDRLEDRSCCGYGWHLPWILTIALYHARTQVHSFSCRNTAVDSRITPGLHLFHVYLSPPSQVQIHFESHVESEDWSSCADLSQVSYACCKVTWGWVCLTPPP